MAHGIARVVARVASTITGKPLRMAPCLSMPVATLSNLLPNWLSMTGIEEGVEEWGSSRRSPGVLRDVMDGRIWKGLLGVDQKPFFATGLPNNELRLGLSISLDWLVTYEISSCAIVLISK